MLYLEHWSSAYIQRIYIWQTVVTAFSQHVCIRSTLILSKFVSLYDSY